jgi:hypothetical protein
MVVFHSLPCPEGHLLNHSTPALDPLHLVPSQVPFIEPPLDTGCIRVPRRRHGSRTLPWIAAERAAKSRRSSIVEAEVVT